MSSCPKGFFCFDNQTVGLLAGASILLVSYAVLNKKKDVQLLDELKYRKNEKMKNLMAEKEDTIKNLESRVNNLENNKKDESVVVVSATSNDMLVNKEYERLVNPLLPPERSYNSTYRVPINIPTRGHTQSYQQVGAINCGDQVLPLYGRPRWPGASRWNYYTSTDGYHSIKLPIKSKSRDCQDDNGCEELYDGESIQVPLYQGKDFKVSIYNLDKPRYIPLV